MAGALATAAGYDDDEDYAAPDDEDYGSEQPSGALSLAQGQTPGPDAEEWLNRAASGLGSPEEIGGALSRQMGRYDEAKERQLQLIRAARERIPSAGRGNVALPLLFAAAALGSPTRTGSTAEGLAGAFRAAGNQLERERGRDIQRSDAMGRLDLLEGQAGVQGAQTDYGFLKDKLTIGREAAAASVRNKAYRESIAQRDAAAKAAAADRAERDKEMQQYHEDIVAQRRDAAETGSWQAGEGIDPTDPTETRRVPGMYQLPKRAGDAPIFYPGKTLTGRGAGAGRAAPALQQNIEYMIQQKMFEDSPEGRTAAADFIKSAAGSSAKYATIVQQNKERLAKAGKPSADGAFMPYTENELNTIARDQARETVQEANRISALPKQFNRPLAGPDTVGILSAGAGAKPAPAAAPPPAPPQAQREPGKVYQTPKGPLTWTGTGWRQ